MKVLYIAPGSKPEEREIEDKPSVIAGLIGGTPLAMPFPLDWAAMLIDPRASWKDAAPNIRYKGAQFYGPVIIVGMQRDRHLPLTKEQVTRYTEMFGGGDE